MSKIMMGKSFHNVDSKGRLIIPVKFRDGLGSHFVLTRGFDNCILCYSMDVWTEFVEKLIRLGNKSQQARTLRREFVSNAEEVEVDSQGRILIPSELRTMYGIKKEVAVVADGTEVEIWDKATYDQRFGSDKTTLSPAELQDLMDEMDFDF